jgi:type IV secretion system protein VirD4
VSITAIIQSFAQLQKNYGKEGCEIITDNTQLTVFGGFAPNSESAQVLSKALGSRTVQSGSVNRGKNDPSQSLQMIERALLTPDELKSLPKGTFVVMKTGFYPMQVKLKLFFDWGIVFSKEVYSVEDKGNRKVSYANKANLEEAIVALYPSKSGNIKKAEGKATHVPKDESEPEIIRDNNPVAKANEAFQNRKPGAASGTKTDDNTTGGETAGGDGVLISQSNVPDCEETEIIINEKGEIVNERVRDDFSG